MSDFDFRATEAWEVSTGVYLGAGNHVCSITAANATTSSGGNPQIELEVGNDNGTLRDWIVITPASFGKVVMLAQAAGVEPTEEEAESFKTNGGRAPDTWLRRLEGKQIGVVAREEADFKDPSKTRVRVQGYVPYERIASASDVTPIEEQIRSGNGEKAKTTDDIPF